MIYVVVEFERPPSIKLLLMVGAGCAPPVASVCFGTIRTVSTFPTSSPAFVREGLHFGVVVDEVWHSLR
jgi:hypothetical protein